MVGMHTCEVNTLRDAVSSGKTSCKLLLPWRMAAGQIGPVMVSETGSGGKLMMRAVVDSIEEITTLSRLRKEESFQRASKVLQEVWLKKLGRVKGKGENPSSKRSTRKVLFLWTLTQMKSLTSQLMVPEGFVRRTVRLSSQKLIRLDAQQPLPQMRLKSTAQYFVGRLSPEDRQRLQETCSFLDKKVIQIGTTCSGAKPCRFFKIGKAHYLDR